MTAASKWSSRVEMVAAQLRALAAEAPSPCIAVPPLLSGTAAAAATCLTGHDVARLEADARVTDVARVETARIAREINEIAGAAAAAGEVAAAARAEASRLSELAAGHAATALAERASGTRAAQSAVGVSRRRLSNAEAAATAAARAFEKQRLAQQAELEALRSACDADIRQAKASRAAAERAIAARMLQEQLQEATSRQWAALARVAAAEECAEGRQRTVKALRVQLEAPCASSARAATLEARIAELEREHADRSQELEESLEQPQDSQEMLDATQETNRHVMAEVRDARSAQQASVTARDVLRVEVEELRMGCAQDMTWATDLEDQVLEAQEAEAVARREVDRWTIKVADLEQRARGADAAADAQRVGRLSVEAALGEALRARRRQQEAVDILEWKLRSVVDRLNQNDPAKRLGRCLLSRTPVSSLTTRALPKTRRGIGEGSDAEASTTAGESCAETL